MVNIVYRYLLKILGANDRSYIYNTEFDGIQRDINSFTNITILINRRVVYKQIRELGKVLIKQGVNLSRYKYVWGRGYKI